MIQEDTTLEDFLKQSRIDNDTWNESQCNWSVIKAIGLDHQKRIDTLKRSASYFATEIQSFEKVHSVRWRVKDSEHLLEKIIRKCAEKDKNKKYKNISTDNYTSIVTDLVGVRALHLFKDDCFGIDENLKKFKKIEKPIVYFREGDNKNEFRKYGFKTKPHDAGYRSVHYVISTQPFSEKVTIELQVRTIFEEGWSEIDHKVRYPNFSDNPLVGYFLTIFNRMAGTADEMGSFVVSLTTALQEYNQVQNNKTKEKEITLQTIGRTIAELENEQKDEKIVASLAVELKNQFENLENTIRADSFLSAQDSFTADIGRIVSFKDFLLMEKPKIKGVEATLVEKPKTKGAEAILMEKPKTKGAEATLMEKTKIKGVGATLMEKTKTKN